MRIKKFQFFIGGYGGTNYSLEYKNKVFQYRSYDHYPVDTDEQNNEITITIRDLNFSDKMLKNDEAIARIDNINANLEKEEARIERFISYSKRCCKHWDKEYRDPGYCDGTQWGIDIHVDDFKFKSQGSNNFPNNFSAMLWKLKVLTRGKEFR